MSKEDAIQQEIDRRFAAENAAPASAPATSEVATDNTVASGDDTYDKLAAAEQAAKEQEEKNKSLIPGVDYAQSIYESLPENAKPIAEAGAGYVAGKALRKLLPQQHVIGTPEFEDVQSERRMESRGVAPAQQKLAQAKAVLEGAQDQHQTRGQILDQQRMLAEQNHQANVAELEQARLQNTHAQTLNAADELARQSNPHGLALPNASQVSPNLTRQPLGGEGTYNYSTKFGAAPEEAMRVPSMSAMQQQNIPQQTKALGTIERIAPEFQSFQESPLLLGGEGQQAVRERIAQEATNQQRQQSQQDIARKQMEADIARHKAESQIRLEKAQEAARASAKAAADAAKAHAAHTATTPTTPEQRASVDANQQAADELEARVRKNAPGALARIGVKLAGRFVPGAGAAVAPLEAEAAKKDWEQKNYGRAAMHGLGAAGALAQATGVPFLMGAGDIAQIPAAGLAAYDYFNERQKSQK